MTDAGTCIISISDRNHIFKPFLKIRHIYYVEKGGNVNSLRHCRAQFFYRTSFHKTLSYCEAELSFETITLLDQLICTRRQVNFQIHKECNIKIGLNTTANKFYPLNNRISLCMLNMNFVPFKRAAKILFLKFGKTWIINVEVLCILWLWHLKTSQL